jgi:hypothetical protein
VKKPSTSGKKPSSTAKKPSGSTKKPGTSTKRPGSTAKKPGSGSTKKPGSGSTKKPGSTAKKPGSKTPKKPSTAKKPRKPLKPKVKNALQRKGLAKSFRNFKYRWWSNRWKNWLFYNPLDRGWYCFAPGCDCFVPADCCAYDPPDACEGPDDDDCGCPPQAMQCQVLPPDNTDVEEPEEPSNEPPPLPGVDNDNQPAGGCCCGTDACTCKKPGGKPCGNERCRCSEE